jgi:6-phosphofructokinase 2
MSRVVTLTPNPAIDVSTSVDRIVATRKLRCTEARRDPGGGGINVARVIRRLGGDVTALFPVGGTTGRLLHRLVEEEGITNVTVEVMEETREDFTVLETASAQQFRFVLPGPRLNEAEWQGCLDALAAIDVDAEFIVASGSLPISVPDDFYARTARRAKKLGAKLVLDASGRALAAALDEGIHLVKPNLGELRTLVGGPLDDEAQYLQASRALIAAGKTEIVALTLGHRGALLVTRELALRAPPLAIPVAGSVGAGDSFLGGLVFSLARGDGLPEAFRHAVAAGSAALLNPGTRLCSATEVQELYGAVIIEAV